MSALDLLQLLLNPLGALNPAVPEEALALPSGSLKATSLKTPIPAPTEQAHLTTTGLSLGSKSKALSTSADVLRNAGQRLRTTTDTAQAEWTELLRIKRGGEWRMEARASASASGAGSTSEYANIDRLARDVCVFCGIDEASAAWRQAGLARFNDSKGKGRATDQATFKLPDRIGGRRRLALSVSFGSAARATYTYAPEALSAEISDTHSQLAQLQVELFEEELFARLIQEVRDGDLDAEATRDSLELRIPEHEATLRLHMLASGSKQAAVSTNPEQGLQHLPELLHAVARLAMLRLYKRRRRRNTTKDLADQIIPHLIAVTQYVLFVRQIRERLQDAADACRRSGVYSSADSVVLHFDACTDAVSDITADLASESDEERGGPILRLGGSATFIIGSRSLHFTFRAPATLIVHLPDRDLALDVNAQLRLILQQAVLAATLGQVAILLQDLCHACPDWQSETLPKTIDSTTRALAKQKSEKHSSAPAAFLCVFTVLAAIRSADSVRCLQGCRRHDRRGGGWRNDSRHTCRILAKGCW